MGWGQPLVKLTQPVLQCVDGHHAQHGAGRRVVEQDVHKADDLHGLAQTHGVGQDATKSRGGVILGKGLHDVVIEEANPSHLEAGRGRHKGEGGKGQGKEGRQSEERREGGQELVSLL